MTWYDDMAKLVHKRNVALAGLDRWQVKVTAAEEEIAALTAQMESSRTAPATLPAADEVSAETDAAVPVIVNTFGAEPTVVGSSPFFTGNGVTQ